MHPDDILTMILTLFGVDFRERKIQAVGELRKRFGTDLPTTKHFIDVLHGLPGEKAEHVIRFIETIPPATTDGARLKGIEKENESYRRNIELLCEQNRAKQDLIRSYETKMAELRHEHEDEIAKLRKEHAEQVKQLQNDYDDLDVEKDDAEDKLGSTLVVLKHVMNLIED